MKFSLLLILSIFSHLGYAESIAWYQPEELNIEEEELCPEIGNYIDSFEARKDNHFQVWKLDVNQDSQIDYLIWAGVFGYCGSLGCTTQLFVNKGDTCQTVNSPHLHFDQKIGIDKEKLFVPVERCGVWKLDKTKLVHVENRDSCE